MSVYGKITIIGTKLVNNKILCRCECGAEKWINIYNIKKGDVKSCGCLKKHRMKSIAKIRFSKTQPANFTDWSGRRIGLCVVVRRVNLNRSQTWWLLKCDCGNEFMTQISTLRRAKYKKCRCEFSNHPLKNTLQGMIDRCTNTKSKSYKWYGEKSIKVCSEWSNYPNSFIKWSLENGWKKGLSIDRINANGDYEPNNCQWITKKENSQKSAKERWEQKNLE